MKFKFNKTDTANGIAIDVEYVTSEEIVNIGRLTFLDANGIERDDIARALLVILQNPPPGMIEVHR